MSIQLLNPIAFFADQMMVVLRGPFIAFSSATQIQNCCPAAIDEKVDFSVESDLAGLKAKTH